MQTPLPILQLHPGRERSVFNRHPWVFSGAVDAVDEDIKEGDIVQVTDAEGNVLGYGFFSEKSQITCRMFEWSREHIDVTSFEYWKSKIQQALALRKSSVISKQTNAYRLLHAEGDFFPGLIADVYNNVVVIQALIKGTEERLPMFVKAFNECGFPNVYLKAKTSSHHIEEVRTESGFLSGGVEGAVEILENGVKFKVDFVEGQKTGFFLDQRDNRELLRTYAKGKTILNTFSYTGGFSAYAAMDAKHIDSVDISKEAVQQAEENVKLNNKNASHAAIAEDCFEFLKAMPANHYDLIVLDPPAFAKTARAVDNATRGYKQINMRAFQKIKPGGLLFTFSCSQNISKELFQKIVFGAAADARRNVRIIHQLHQPCDHPINIFHPEGEYLKGLVLWVE